MGVFSHLEVLQSVARGLSGFVERDECVSFVTEPFARRWANVDEFDLAKVIGIKVLQSPKVELELPTVACTVDSTCGLSSCLQRLQQY